VSWHHHNPQYCILTAVKGATCVLPNEKTTEKLRGKVSFWLNAQLCGKYLRLVWVRHRKM